MNRRKLYGYAIIGLVSAFLFMLFIIAPKSKPAKELIIYDVHTDSPRIVKDDGSIEFADYLRIKNVTDHPYNLTGLFLSDNRKNYKKLPLDGIVIEPQSDVMIKLDPSWNFYLKRSGEENVYLSDGRGNTLFKYISRMMPEAPQLSAESGFYDDEFDISISVMGDYPIYYTLDGSEPDESSSLYTGPIHVYDRSKEPNSVVNVVNTIKNYNDEIYMDEESGTEIPVEKPNDDPVDKAFIIRAVAMDENGNKSEIVTREFFFCGNKYKNIISIIADRDDLFGDYGILSTGKAYDEWYLSGQEGDEPPVNYHNKGRNWEIAADMDYFRGNTRVLEQKCGLRLQGRTTRDRRIKNFQIRARNRYSGSDVFEYDFFEGEKFRSDGLILDDSFKESFFLDLIKDEDIIKQRTTDRVALFLNGEFWNNVYIRSKIDEEYFLNNYGIEPDNLVVLAESFPEMGIKTDEELAEAQGWYLAIDDLAESNDLSKPENYDKIKTMMDMDTYIDYLAVNTWAGCTDWGEFNNDMYWRVRTPDNTPYGDGRFRWMIHDADAIFNKDFELKDFALLTDAPLYPGLLRNTAFRNKLADRLIQLGNTSFSDENVESVLASGRWDEPELTEIKEFFKYRKVKMEEIIESINP